MTFELLFKDKFVLKNPWVLLPFSFAIAIIGQLLAMVVFDKSTAGIVGVAFTTIPLVQIFMQLMKDQEKHIVHDHKFVLKHSILIPFGYMLIGLILAYTVLYTVFPEDLREQGFSEQIESIYSLEGPFGFAIFDETQFVTQSSCLALGVDKTTFPEDMFDLCHTTDYDKDGINEILLEKEGLPAYIISEKGELYSYNNFLVRHIFFNNISILLFIFVTSFIFGAGAIFILVWNASIIGVFLGDALHKTTNYMIGNVIYAYTLDLPKLIGPLLIHGTFEFIAFFIASIAGGVLSVGMLKHKFKSKSFHTIVFTSVTITLISVVLLLIGAFLESYI